MKSVFLNLRDEEELKPKPQTETQKQTEKKSEGKTPRETNPKLKRK